MDDRFPAEPQAPVHEEPFALPPQDSWLPSPSLNTPSSQPAPSRPFDLRPLTAGEILDRTFAIYRHRFWLFAGIGGIAGAARTLVSAVQMLINHFLRAGAPGMRMGVTAIAFTFVALIASVLFMALGFAALAFAVGEIYLANEVSVRSAWKAVSRRWLGFTGILFWQVGSFAWIPTLVVLPAAILAGLTGRTGNPGLIGVMAVIMVLGGFGGSIGGLILLIRNLLAQPAAVIEALPVRASMRRSKALAAGAKGRIFLVCVITFCLFMIVGVLQAPFSFMMLFAISKGQEAIGSMIGTLLIGFIGSSLVMPVFMIGMTIIYFDQRVRKEALDIAMRLQQSTPTPVAPPVAGV